MPTLSRWFQEEHDRLIAAGKSVLAESFETFRAAAFLPDVPAALAALPDLYRLSDALGEPVWRLAADYYALFVACHWRGDVARALDVATQASVRAAREPDARPVLALYLEESLLDAWLCADAPRYAADVIAAADGTLSSPLPPDVVTRFNMLRASATVVIDPTYGPSALGLVMDHLPALDWPDAYRRKMVGVGLAWAERLDEALTETEAAVDALDALGCHIEATEARLFAGTLRLRLGDPSAALWTFRNALSSAERLINRAHVGFAQAGIGRALIAVDDLDGGAAWLAAALATLDGLGWLRAEAEIKLDCARALEAASQPNTTTAGYEAEVGAAPLCRLAASNGAEDWIA